MDIGPIVSDRGVDLGPVVAARIRERRLADARYVGAPAGASPFVTGRIRTEHADAGWSSSYHGGIWLVGIGGSVLVGSGVLYALGQNATRASERDSVSSVATAVGAVSLAAVIGGILLLTQPTRYREGTLVADLNVRRGQTSTPIRARDETTVHHGIYEEDDAGGPLLDGVVNAICKETGK